MKTNRTRLLRDPIIVMVSSLLMQKKGSGLRARIIGRFFSALPSESLLRAHLEADLFATPRRAKGEEITSEGDGDGTPSLFPRIRDKRDTWGIGGPGDGFGRQVVLHLLLILSRSVPLRRELGEGEKGIYSDTEEL